jgi:hypothetical protein
VPAHLLSKSVQRTIRGTLNEVLLARLYGLTLSQI